MRQIITVIFPVLTVYSVGVKIFTAAIISCNEMIAFGLRYLIGVLRSVVWLVQLCIV